MLRKFVPVLGLLALPAVAAAQFEAGDFEFTLTGRGTAPKATDGATVGVEAAVGYFLTRELSVGVRQAVTFIDLDPDAPGVDENAWGGSTFGYADYHFDFGAWQPYVGVFGGSSYAEFSDGDGAIGPEAGVKYFVNGTTFIFGNVQYVYTLDENDDSYFAGQVGVGFRF